MASGILIGENNLIEGIANKYSVKEYLVSGMVGKIFLGTCLQTGTSVCIKTSVKKDKLRWESFFYVTLTGADITPEFRSYFVENQSAFIVTKYDERFKALCLYTNLREWVGETILPPDTDRLSIEMRKLIVANLLKCVERLFNWSVTHGDIKAENILVDVSTGEVKLIDFDTSVNLLSKDVVDTSLKYVRGTGELIAPEMQEMVANIQSTISLPFEKKIDLLKGYDIYSLGYTIFEILFDYDYNTVKHLDWHSLVEPKYLQILERMLEKDYTKRAKLEEVVTIVDFAVESVDFLDT